jgi:hypothetical protein
MTAVLCRGGRLRLATAAVALAGLVAPALALEEPPGEKAALKACEKQLCTMVLEKSPKGQDLACEVQKTWASSTLEKGESKGVSWGFGDARCKLDLKLERADVAAALTRPKHTVSVPAHEVHCVVERDGELKPVTAKLAPKIKFKGGKADKVWINLESIEGPADVKSTIWAAAQLEDTLGIFHRPMLKQINKFLHRQCPRRYGPKVAVKGKPAAKKPAAAKPVAAKPDATKPDAPAAKDAPPAAVKEAASPPAKATAATP